MRLRQRITLPFALLFAAAFALTALVAMSLVAKAVERRLVENTENLARVLADAPGFRTVVGHIKDAYRADVYVLERGVLVASTSEPPAFRPEPGVLQENGVVYAPIGTDGALVMRYDPEVVSREKADAIKPVALAAAIALALVVLLGIVTAQTIARPLERLAESARRITAGSTGVSLPAGGGGEIRDLAEALNRMLQTVRLGERLAAMGQVAVGVAHEIRNPLSAMKMTVQMLREERKPEGREPYDLLLREIARLELAAGELSAAGPRPLARQRARLDAVVNDVLELMRRQLEHLGVRVERAFESVPEVEIDVDRFKRVVMNLVLNGAQAMPQGGRLTLALAARDGAVRFSVADTGPGVPPEVRDRVFEPFVTTKQDGVGLGLALTKLVVEEHGGTIGFESSAAGATFWVDLRPGTGG